MFSVLSWTLAVLPALTVPAWAATPATALLVLDLLALRVAARRRTVRARRAAAAQARAEVGAARRAAAVEGGMAAAAPDRTAQVSDRVRGRSSAGRPAAPPAGPVPTAAAGGGARGRSVAASTVRTVPMRSAASSTPVVVRPDPSDRGWEDETGPIVAVERPNPLDPDDGWAPVAVPPPTYTLKPVVPWPSLRTWHDGTWHEAARHDGTWQAERDFADDLDLDAVLARRRAVNG